MVSIRIIVRLKVHCAEKLGRRPTSDAVIPGVGSRGVWRESRNNNVKQDHLR